MRRLPSTLVRLTALLAFELGGVAIAQPADSCEAQRLVSPPEVPTTTFGTAIVTNGEYWFVSDHSASTLCGGSALECGTGAVFVYQEFDGQLELVQTLVPPDVQLYDNYGASLDVDGNRLIVGVPGAAWPGSGLRQGMAYMYELRDGLWVEAGRLEPPAEVTESFGTNTILSGDIALVLSSRPASVFRYEKLGDNWVPRGTVETPDPLTRDDCFGCAGAAHGSWVFLSAYYDDSMSREGGSVYAFRKRPDNTLDFVQKIEELGTRRFGLGIDADERTLAVGAYLTEGDVRFQGSLYVYGFNGERWVMEQEVRHADAEELDQFGSTVAVSGDQMLVAAYGGSSPPSVAGRVYRFDRNVDGRWYESGTLEISPPVIARDYGVTLGLSGSHALVGAQREMDAAFRSTGAAYFFDLACSPCPADLDADGTLTVFDFLTFLNLFQDADPLADFDGDGELTIFDFLAFQTAFDAGCD